MIRYLKKKVRPHDLKESRWYAQITSIKCEQNKLEVTVKCSWEKIRALIRREVDDQIQIIACLYYLDNSKFKMIEDSMKI